MSTNNAVILLKAQTYGPIFKGETMDFIKRLYEYNDFQDGDFVVQTLWLSDVVPGSASRLAKMRRWVRG